MKPDIQERLKNLTPAQRELLRRKLAEQKAGKQLDAETVSRSAIPAHPERKDYPLSPSQERLWVVGQLSPEAQTAYNVSFACLLDGRLNVAALERAFRRMIQHFAVLRLQFFENEDGACQRVRDDVESWQLDSLGLDTSGDDAFQRAASHYASSAFDLVEGFPLRAACGRISDTVTGLVIALHHIVCDGWSLPLLSQSLELYYRLECSGEGNTPEPLSFQYPDYVLWLQEWLKGDDAFKQRDYWKNQLAALPEPLELNPDFIRPSVQRFHGAHRYFRFTAEEMGPLMQEARKSGASSFITLYALYVALLYRWSGQNDLVVGAPAAGRIHPELEKQVGLFVNTLALRARLQEGWNLHELLIHCRDTVLQGFENEAIPFDAIVEQLAPQRDLSRSPLFDVMIGLNDGSSEQLNLHGLETKPVQLDQATSKVDLTFHFTQFGNDFELDIEYATALFRPDTIDRLAQTFRSLVRAWGADSTQSLADVSLMGADELRGVVDGFNPERQPYPSGQGIVQLFREQVTKAPEAPAVVFQGGKWTYRKLDQISDRVAHLLVAQRALRPEEAVGVRMERSPLMLAVILGILKAGGCYLPLKEDTPEDRERGILEEAETRILFVDRGENVPAEWGGDILDASAVCGQEVPNEGEGIYAGGRADQLAYIIFTSGSTGKPKGTLVEQRSVVRLVCNTDYVQLGPEDRVLQTGSLAFDASTFEIWGPLLNGGCCCLSEGRSILAIDAFGDLFDRFQANTCFLTTGLFNQIAEFNPAAFAGLKTLLTGGEKVSTVHVNKVRSAAPELRLLHVYGPTENTTFSTWYEVNQTFDRDIPIGRAIAHSTVYILDPRGHPVPPGVVGELYCGGDGIARGYLKRPGLTAELFVPDPFASEPGSRLYRTGDFAKWDESGSIIFVGRRDDQVKVRGFRIELGEIEARLREHPVIRQAVVIARPRGGTHELLAYLVGETDAAGDLRSFLGRELPDYMVPAHFIWMEALPLNASGKVHRGALPEPEMRISESPEGGEALELEDAASQTLASVWRKVLGVPVASLDADYFHQGGDSIKAIQMVARLKQAGFALQLRDVFEHPSFSALKDCLRPIEAAAGQKVSPFGEVPLTPVQQWFLSRSEEPYHHFNQSTFLRARERLDPAKLESALHAVFAVHPMLRVALSKNEGGEWTQQVSEELPATVLSCHDLRSSPHVSEAIEEAARRVQLSFQLNGSPLLKAALFQMDDGDRLLLVVHHWAVDGISWRILLEDLEQAYAGGALEVEPASFRQWSLAARKAGQEGRFRDELDYWRSLAAKVPPPCQPKADSHGGIIDLELPANLSNQLLEDARRVTAAQPQEILCAAFLSAWQAVTGKGELLLAMEGHGREDAIAPLDLSRTVAWFTSIYPVLVEAGVNEDLLTLLRATKDRLRSVPRRGAGFGILRYLDPETAQGGMLEALNPQISFNFLGSFETGSSGMFSTTADEPCGENTALHLKAPFNLDFVAELINGCLRIHIEDHVGLLNDSERNDLKKSLINALETLASLLKKSAPVPSVADFTATHLSIEELDTIREATSFSLQDILPLTPMQQGMFFHSMAETHSEAYCDQVCLRLRGSVDPDIFGKAWQSLGTRHPHLVGHFYHGDLGQPVLLVPNNATLPFAFVDGSKWTAEDVLHNLSQVRREARNAGFDLTQGMNLRMTLVSLPDTAYEVIIGFHHAVLDGWSSGNLWAELEQTYRHLTHNGPSLASAVPISRYLRWLMQQNTSAALAYWKEVLAETQTGITVPPAIPRLGQDNIRTRSFEWQLDASLTGRFDQWARQHGATLNQAFQTFWGLFLGQLNGCRDAVFGATVSGRPDSIEGVDSMVGLLINTVPVRVQWEEGESVSSVLQRVRTQQIEGQRHLAFSLAELQGAVEVGSSLIRQTVVFENYPLGEKMGQEEGRLWEVTPVDIHDPMHFEFGLIVVPGKQGILCRVVADDTLYPDAYLSALGAQWQAFIERCLENAEVPGYPDAARPWSLSMASTFTADLMVDTFQWWGDRRGKWTEVRVSPFNQVFQELLNPQSSFRIDRGSDKLLLIRLQDWLIESKDLQAREEALEEDVDRLVDGIRDCLRDRQSGDLLLVLCPSTGSCAVDTNAMLERMHRRIERRLAPLEHVALISAEEATALYAVEGIEDPEAEQLGGVPYQSVFLTALAMHCLRRWDSLRRPPLKVIALDADNTLWKGVVGEDGPDGLKLTSSHRALQECMLQQKESGRLLVLVTKNNPEDVAAAFLAHPEFPLKQEDFTVIRAGWGAKSASLRSIADQLNLGLDSFVFIDDSAMECAEVSAACPQVLSLRWPEDEAAQLHFLQHCWLLDTDAVTAEDRKRAVYYKEEAERSSFREKTGDIQSFLAGLELKVDFCPVDESTLPRAAQLTQRTNQFNSTTRRRTEEEVRTFLEKEGQGGFLVSVRDRFGDYGLAGLVLYRCVEKSLCVDSLMLSCRVLGRGVEHAVMRHLTGLAQSLQLHSILVDAIPTPRNAPVMDFLKSRGEERGSIFSYSLNEKWALDVPSNPKTEAEVSQGRRSEINAHSLSVAPSIFYQYIAEKLITACAIEDIMRSSQGSAVRMVRHAYAAPQGNAEEVICRIWAEVLGVEQVGRHDHFFSLGGHSLKAVMVLGRIARDLQRNVRIQDIFDASTPAELAKKIGTADSVVLDTIECLTPQNTYPLSYSQQRLWLLEQMRGEEPSPFHMTAAFRINGALDSRRLEKAFQVMIQRHESLRTVFAEEGHAPVQRIIESFEWKLETAEVSGVGAFKSTAVAFSRRPFDLEKGPLLRVLLCSLEDDSYGMVVCMHHIISDGWSVSVMAKELSGYYSDSTFSLPPLSIHYKEFAHWQKSILSGVEGERLSTYWNKCFRELPPPLELPADQPRPAIRSSQGSSNSYHLDVASSKQVQALAQVFKVSSFAVLLATVEILLARISRNTAFTIGTPVSGRIHPSLEDQIGFYVNLLPVKARPDLDSTFQEHAVSVAHRLNQALDHAAYPFDRLVEDLNLPRDTSRSPLFDVLVVYQNNQSADLQMGDCLLETIPLRSETTQYDLTFNFADTPDGLHLELEYDSVLFSSSRIDQWVKAFHCLIRAACQHPTSPLHQLPLLNESTVRTLQHWERGERWNVRDERMMDTRFHDSAQQHPHHLAVLDGAQEWSYRELDQRAEGVARSLDACGVQPGTVVAVSGPRNASFVASLLGILRVGAIYLPLEASLPDERLQDMLTQSGCPLALGSDPSVCQRLHSLGLQVIDGSAVEPIEGHTQSTASPDDPAYLIFTSGSTGRPKGVLVSHTAFSSMIDAQIEAFGIKAEDRCLWFASCAFDASLSEIFLALSAGATLVTAPETTKESTAAYLEWIQRRAVTVATIPPAFLRAFRRQSLKPLRVVISAGEAADPGDARHYSTELSFFNAYGPTETAVCATIQRVDPEASMEHSVPIGKPISTATVYVLDDRGNRVPVGCQGELCIGGAIVGIGYLGDSERTDRQFVPDPFSGCEGARYYRTGDLVSWRSDGTLEYHGRKDEQIKLRGFRIELNEIEEALRSLQGFEDAAVVVYQGNGTESLIAYVTGSEIDPERVRSVLSRKLPSYMIPAQCILLETLPLNASGKVDRKALQARPLPAHIELTVPQTEREIALATCWREALQLETVGRESDYFASGGDSIKALDLIGRLREAGWSLNLQELYRNPHLSDLARSLQPLKVSVDHLELSGVVPFLPIQAWFLKGHQASPLSHFNQSVYYRCPKRVDTTAMESAMTEVWKHHPALRAGFRNVDGEWTQTITSPDRQTPRLEVVDLTHVDPEEQSLLLRDVEAKMQSRFSLDSPPLWAMVLVRLGEEEKLLCITHHLISDWVSHRVLLDDLNRAYAQALKGEIIHLPPASTPFPDWVEQAGMAIGEGDFRAEDLIYWKKTVEQSLRLEQPFSSGTYGEAVLVNGTLDADKLRHLKERLRSLENAGGTPLNVRDAILYALCQAYGRCLHRQAIGVMLESHGRHPVFPNHPVDRTIGWFTSLYPHVIQLTDEPRERALPALARSLAAIPRHGMGYSWLQAYDPERRLLPARTELGFNYLGAFQSDSGESGFVLDEHYPAFAIAPDFERDHPLDLTAWEMGSQLHFTLALSPELNQQVSADQLLHQFELQLNKITEE